MSQQSNRSKEAGVSVVWGLLRTEAQNIAEGDHALASLMASAILSHDRLGDALSHLLASKLGDQDLDAMTLRGIIDKAHEADPSVVEAVAFDLKVVPERDPACTGYVRPFLFFKGSLALQAYRVAHSLHQRGQQHLASRLQNRCSERFHVDIHPAARIGRGAFLDHGSGVVIGESASVGDDVSIMQGVTVGSFGVGRVQGHPSIGNGVLLSAGATVLGNIRIGDHAKIAAGSVVLGDVPAGCTAVGVPARLVNCPSGEELARAADGSIRVNHT